MYIITTYIRVATIISCVFTVFIKLCTVLSVHLPPTNPEEITTVVFPEDGDTQITIPASAIIHQRNTEGSYIHS